MIHPAPDRTLDFAAVRRALSREGVRPGRMILLADGTVEGDRFRIDGWPGSFPIEDAPPPGHRRLRATVLIDGTATTLRPTD